jgi:cell division septum initiation protein DivIVA
MELADKISNERALQYDEEASILIASAKSLTEGEEKRRKHAVDLQVSLQNARAEVSKLEESFQEMEDTRGSEVRSTLKEMSDYDVETREQIKAVENLKLKIKLEDTSLKTKIRLFEDTEKFLLLKTLEETKKKTLSAEKKYQDLTDVSNEGSIEFKLQADFEHKIDEETIIWDTKNKNVISRCNEHLKSK